MRRSLRSLLAAEMTRDAPTRGVDDDCPVSSVERASVRVRCNVVGAVVALEVATRPVTFLDVVVDDGTGLLCCRFFGRQAIAGVDVGRRIRVEGRVVRNIGRECLLNPVYEFVDVPESHSHTST
jgi:hypothetical protein